MIDYHIFKDLNNSDRKEQYKIITLFLRFI